MFAIRAVLFAGIGVAALSFPATALPVVSDGIGARDAKTTLIELAQRREDRDGNFRREDRDGNYKGNMRPEDRDGNFKKGKKGKKAKAKAKTS